MLVGAKVKQSAACELVPFCQLRTREVIQGPLRRMIYPVHRPSRDGMDDISGPVELRRWCSRRWAATLAFRAGLDPTFPRESDIVNPGFGAAEMPTSDFRASASFSSPAPTAPPAACIFVVLSMLGRIGLDANPEDLACGGASSPAAAPIESLLSATVDPEIGGSFPGAPSGLTPGPSRLGPSARPAPLPTPPIGATCAMMTEAAAGDDSTAGCAMNTRTKRLSP